jgi:hypothetical protein
METYLKSYRLALALVFIKFRDALKDYFLSGRRELLKPLNK